MSFKNPIKLANLPKVKGGQFLKVTATILSKKFLDGNSIPFLILTNHIYLGFDEKSMTNCSILISLQNVYKPSAHFWLENNNQPMRCVVTFVCLFLDLLVTY